MPGWGQTLDQRVARPCQAVARGHLVSERGKGHFSDIRFLSLEGCVDAFSSTLHESNRIVYC